MGDAGALLVGLLMAASTRRRHRQHRPRPPHRRVRDPDDLLGASGLLPAFIPILLPFAVLIVPLLDFGLAVLRRLRAGKSPFSRRPQAPAPPPARHGAHATSTRC